MAVRLVQEALHLAPDPVRDRVLVHRGGVIRVEAGGGEVGGHELLLALRQAVVDGVAEEVLEEVEEDEVQVVDAAAVHAVVRERRHEEDLVVVLHGRLERVVGVHVRPLPRHLVLLRQLLVCLQVGTPLGLCGGLVAAAAALDRGEDATHGNARRIMRPAAHLREGLHLAARRLDVGEHLLVRLERLGGVGVLRPLLAALALAPYGVRALAHAVRRLSALHVRRRDRPRRDGLADAIAVDAVDRAGGDDGVVRVDGELEVGTQRRRMVVALSGGRMREERGQGE